MLGEIRAETWRIFGDVTVDGCLITRFVPDAITMLTGAGKGRAHEPSRRKQLRNVTPHVAFVRVDQVRSNERGYFVCNHLKHRKRLITTTVKLSTQNLDPLQVGQSSRPSAVRAA